MPEEEVIKIDQSMLRNEEELSKILLQFKGSEDHVKFLGKKHIVANFNLEDFNYEIDDLEQKIKNFQQSCMQEEINETVSKDTEMLPQEEETFQPEEIE
jgi:hypothetical protein